MTPTDTDSPDCFVAAVADRRPAIVDVIRGARRRLTLSLFRCNDAEILGELATATARGVEVEVLVTSRAKGGRKKIEKLWRALGLTGATVHSYTDPVVKYHAKYLVADDATAIVASLNFTKKCFRKTCDALVVTRDPAVVAGLRRLWAADRSRADLPDDLTDRLIVGPERARRQLTALIDQARSSIRIIDAKLSDPDVLSLLKAKRAAGLAVDVFTAKHLGGLKSHGKMMLIDDKVAVVGGLALAALSLDFRREVAIKVTEPDAVAAVAALFGAVREGAPSGGEQPQAGQALC
jgi:phosphatidylserine/phosphatidylglycerophosphate/cardiolipin synthase-like enzyme